MHLPRRPKGDRPPAVGVPPFGHQIRLSAIRCGRPPNGRQTVPGGACNEASRRMMPFRTASHDFEPLPTLCPVTGLPVQGHASWRYTSPGGGYRLRVSVLGDRIVWLQPRGYVRLEDVRAALALLEDVLFAVLPARSTYIAIDDYSAVEGAALDARRFIVNRLHGERRIGAYIVYGAGQAFRLGLALVRRIGLFPFEVMLVADYAAAARAALERLACLETGRGDFGGRGGAAPDRGRPARPAGPVALEACAADLLAFVGALTLEPYGFKPAFPTVALAHPWRPVYDALSMLRDDRQRILRRHHEARRTLEAEEHALVESQGLLQETHTTLDILLAARQEKHNRLESRMREELQVLLQPLLEDLANRAPTNERAAEWKTLLLHIVEHIGSPLPCETSSMRAPFTARERLIACLLTTGRDVARVAGLLGLSRRSVENHCQRMRRKLGLQGRRPTLRDWLAGQPPRETR